MLFRYSDLLIFSFFSSFSTASRRDSSLAGPMPDGTKKFWEWRSRTGRLSVVGFQQVRAMIWLRSRERDRCRSRSVWFAKLGGDLCAAVEVFRPDMEIMLIYIFDAKFLANRFISGMTRQ